MLAEPTPFDTLNEDDRPTLPTPPPTFETPVEAFFARAANDVTLEIKTPSEAIALQAEVRRRRFGPVVFSFVAIAVCVVAMAWFR